MDGKGQPEAASGYSDRRPLRAGRLCNIGYGEDRGSNLPWPEGPDYRGGEASIGSEICRQGGSL